MRRAEIVTAILLAVLL